jgi:hypothetical protein
MRTLFYEWLEQFQIALWRMVWRLTYRFGVASSGEQRFARIVINGSVNKGVPARVIFTLLRYGRFCNHLRKHPVHAEVVDQTH